MLELIGYVGAMLVGAAIGAMFYRRMLKRSPEAIERLAAQARELGNRF